MNDIPKELVDAIVEHLSADEDTSALRDYSHISQPFLTSCRRHLFRHVHLNTPFRCRRLYLLLICNPQIISFIHEVHIVDWGWASNTTEFTSLLALLVEVGALNAFRFMRRTVEEGVVYTLPISDAFQRICETTETVAIKGIPFCSLLRGLLAPKSVRNLTLVAKCTRGPLIEGKITHANHPTENLPPSNEDCARLSSIDLRCSHFTEVVGHLWPACSTLKSLTVYFQDDSSFPAVRKLIEAASQSLVSLHLDATWLRYTPGINYTMPIFPSNQGLLMLQYPLLCLPYFHIHLNELASRGLPRNIHYLVIAIRVSNGWEWKLRSLLCVSRTSSIKHLDQILAEFLLESENRYQYLKSAYFVPIFGPREALPQSEEIAALLPSARDTGKLRCQAVRKWKLDDFFVGLSASVFA
ncbi:hypothetical protein H0H81_004356 [Sphagnurus paluster]|uniref:Uncharacterized protein n=1 Tax=Sphagnurus paluster TaxID=117069 RepID=A0A9P7GHH4_9AGAR|nr:hypothetical protein H0H81_004356 [Sphagnurus paluster]